MKRAGTTVFLAALTAVSIQTSITRAEDVFPWAEATKTVEAVFAETQHGGVQKVAPYVPALEQVLAEGTKLQSLTFKKGGTLYVLADGGTDDFMAMAAVATDIKASKGKAVAAPSPYPLASLLLGSYYEEIKKPTEALRVLDAGLALPKFVKTGLDLGNHAPGLIIERGVALNMLKQPAEALADYERGLKLPNVPNAERAIMQRGQGFALTELHRLDDAEAAYRASLESEPDNATARKELQYIAGLRASGKAPEACAFHGPSQPRMLGGGVVLSFEDHAASLARIPSSEAQMGGKIDPDYVDNPRVVVRLDDDHTRTMLVPTAMQVHVGDRVTLQDTYRNMKLPCNYIPNLIVSDMGAQTDTASPTASRRN